MESKTKLTDHVISCGTCKHNLRLQGKKGCKFEGANCLGSKVTPGKVFPDWPKAYGNLTYARWESIVDINKLPEELFEI